MARGGSDNAAGNISIDELVESSRSVVMKGEDAQAGKLPKSVTVDARTAELANALVSPADKFRKGYLRGKIYQWARFGKQPLWHVIEVTDSSYHERMCGGKLLDEAPVETARELADGMSVCGKCLAFNTGHSLEIGRRTLGKEPWKGGKTLYGAEMICACGAFTHTNEKGAEGKREMRARHLEHFIGELELDGKPGSEPEHRWNMAAGAQPLEWMVARDEFLAGLGVGSKVVLTNSEKRIRPDDDPGEIIAVLGGALPYLVEYHSKYGKGEPSYRRFSGRGRARRPGMGSNIHETYIVDPALPSE